MAEKNAVKQYVVVFFGTVQIKKLKLDSRKPQVEKIREQGEKPIMGS